MSQIPSHKARWQVICFIMIKSSKLYQANKNVILIAIPNFYCVTQ